MSICSESSSDSDSKELLQPGRNKSERIEVRDNNYDEVPSEKINYFSLQNIGVFIHAFLVSVVSIQGGGFTYAFFLMYLDQSGNMYNIINAVIVLPWGLKVIYAAVNDYVPIFGLRRKPYMIIGWIGTMIISGVLYIAPFPPSRYVIDTNATSNCSELYHNKINHPELRGTDVEYINYSLIYLFAYTLMCVTVAISDTAMDGLMVQYARLEKQSQRGKMQTLMYASRQSGEIARTALAAFGLNWYQYGGPWCSGIRIPGMFLMTFIVSIIAIPVVIFTTKEERVKNPPLLNPLLRKLWYSITTKAVQKVVIFTFINSLALSMSSPADSMIMKYWAQVDNLTYSFANIISGIIQPLGTIIFGMYLRNYNWRITVGWTQISQTVINMIFTLFTIFNVVRNQYFYASDGSLTTIFNAINGICTLLIAVEMCESEIEGVFYGLMMSANNLAQTVGGLAGNIIAIPFDVGTSKRYHEDHTSDRIIIASNELLTYAIQNFLIFAVLPFLPSGIEAAKRWKTSLGISKINAQLLVAMLVFMFFFSILYSFISPYIGV